MIAEAMRCARIRLRADRKAGREGDEGQVEPLDVGRDVASFVRKIKATQKMGWGRGRSQGRDVIRAQSVPVGLRPPGS